jgi:hypothetical protein
MFILKRLNKYFIKHDPIWFSLAYMGIMVSFIVALIYEPSIIVTASSYVKFLSWFFLVGPIALTILHIKNYKKTISSMPRLISLYLQIILMFGCLHFYNSSSFASDQLFAKAKLVERVRRAKVNDSIIVYNGEKKKKVTPVSKGSARDLNKLKNFEMKDSIHGITPTWIEMLIEGEEDSGKILRSALMNFYDSLHFSLITSATVGYGDMYPASFSAKLMVDIQVLMSFFIIAFGVGTFFASKESHREDKE